MKLLPSVFSSLNSRVKIFVFVANSRRHFSIFMSFNEGLEEKNTDHLCRLPFDVRPRLQTLCYSSEASARACHFCSGFSALVLCDDDLGIRDLEKL